LQGTLVRLGFVYPDKRLEHHSSIPIWIVKKTQHYTGIEANKCTVRKIIFLYKLDLQLLTLDDSIVELLNVRCSTQTNMAELDNQYAKTSLLSETL